MTRESDDAVRSTCASACRWGWRHVDEVPVSHEGAVTEADILTHVEFARRLRIDPIVRRCRNPKCDWSQ